MSIVSLITPNQKQLAAGYKQTVGKLLAPLGGLCLSPGEKALIYMGHIWPAAPGLGVNPQPALLAALVEAAYEAGAAQVSLAAQAAPGFDFASCWRLAGYGMLDSYGVACLDLACVAHVERESQLNLACSGMAIAAPLLQADCLINVAKFRVAEGQVFGAALLNLAAAAALPQQAELFPRALVDLHSVLAPDLHVLDAVKGEQGYQPQQRNALLAAYDALALDTTLAALAGLTSGGIEHLALAAQYGLGSAHAADIRLVGADALELFGG